MKFFLISLLIGNILLEANSKVVSNEYCNCNEKPSDDYPICGELNGVTMSFRGSQDLQCHAVCHNAEITILSDGPCANARDASVSRKYKKVEICGCDTNSSDNNPICGLFEGERKTFRGFQELQCYTSCGDAHIEILHDSECKEDKYYDQDNNLKDY